MPRLVALYLPQFHPIEINEKYYGEGFTEWTNVAKAKPLFPGHYQPHIPSTLGFYDLRIPDIRRKQAKMAEEYGIDAFCYWTYWFGNGEQLLDMPIWEVYKDASIRLPFCIAWANHSWEKKLWDKSGTKELIMEQKYLGESDYAKFFYTMLPLLKDERYFKVNGLPFVAIYDSLANPEIEVFINTWRKLAIKEGLKGIYFVANDSDCRNKARNLEMGFDAVYADNVYNIHHHLNVFQKVSLYVLRHIFGIPTVFKYKNAIKYMLTDDAKSRDVIPVVAPNWDHSPRSGRKAIILHDCKPKYFAELLRNTFSLIQEKPEEEQIVLIKAWNEWGEGNHLEPDIKYGKGYLEAIKEEKERKRNKK